MEGSMLDSLDNACDPSPARALDVAYAQAAIYAAHAHAALRRASRGARRLLAWARDGAGHLDLPDLTTDDEDEHEGCRSLRHFSQRFPSEAVWARLGAALTGLAEAARVGRDSDAIRALACELKLDDIEADILQLSVSYGVFTPVEQLWDRVVETTVGSPQRLCANAMGFSLFTGHAPDEVAQRLHSEAPLRASGLLTVREDGTLYVLSRLCRMLTEPARDRQIGRAALVGAPLDANLRIEDFAHLGAAPERAIALLRGAIAEGARGIHLLLYGPVGTGKTELARTLAGAIGVPLYAVGEADAHGGEPTRAERLAELCLSQKLLANAGPTLLIFDEAEDLFAGDGPRGAFDPFDDHALARLHPSAGSRAYIHRLLETTPLPVIWTANNLRPLGPAVLRRMSCCIEMPVPPAPVRATLWTRAAASEGVNVSAADIARLANALPAGPALARSALRAARLMGGDAEMVRWTVDGVVKAMGEAPADAGGVVPDRFDASLLQADADLAALADRLAAPDAPREVSLLLSGPPGTGKSAYARYLAERMGLPVLQRRGSDLLGRYVGESEQRIAAAFAEAASLRAFLIFDEADSLLGARDAAQQSWQVSQVNEMLTWMERHPWPVALTTNLAERLDPAVMRRVLLKVRFGHLTPKQTEAAFRRFFGLEPPAGLAALDRLTPADFALVRRIAALQGTLQDAALLLAALEREQRAKPGASRPMGFRIPA
jgi:MoxR-like ATPase